MARLFITMTDELGSRDGRPVPVYGAGNAEAYLSQSITTSNQTTAALSKKYARITTDTACHVAFSENAVRTADSEVGFYLAAGSTLDVQVFEPGTTTLSVIQAA